MNCRTGGTPASHAAVADGEAFYAAGCGAGAGELADCQRRAPESSPSLWPDRRRRQDAELDPGVSTRLSHATFR